MASRFSDEAESPVLDLYNLSFDTIDDNDDHPPWFSLIQNLSYDQVNDLKTVFKTSNPAEESLSKDQFRDAIDCIYSNSKYSLQGVLLFDDIKKEGNTEITWTDFIDFLMKNLYNDCPQLVNLNSVQILPVPHTKKETIVKIVLIETDKYFCYAMISKYGRVGLYDGNIDFLTTYHLIMTREDITRKEEERRRRNRWVTDAIFLPDVLMFVVTNSARSIVIYEASGLKHVPMWLILSTPNIVESFAYKWHQIDGQKECILFMGDNKGNVSSFQFLQPKVGLLRRKSSDKISLFYWEELPNEEKFLIHKNYGSFHKNNILRLEYFLHNETLVSCSKDPEASVVIKYIRNKAHPYVFKMNRGATCFAVSRTNKILVTGSSDGALRVWNTVIIQKPLKTIKEHYNEIVDVQIMESLRTFFSCSRDGVLKQWDLKEYNCLNSIKIKFPSFSIHGKLIEWGFSSIHPGPKRMSIADHGNNQKANNLSSFQTVLENIRQPGTDKTRSDLWERSHILISCCNYIASVKLKFNDSRLGMKCEMPILPPPPLQNSVLIPKFWEISDSNASEEILKTSKDDGQTEDVNLSGELEMNNCEKRFERLNFILHRDWLEESGIRNDINYKIATLERKKLNMQNHVEKGAPYLALDLQDVEELKLSPNLPVPNKKEIRSLVHDIEKNTQEANAKDIIFSESSSSKSPRSSRSSIAEFPY